MPSTEMSACGGALGILRGYEEEEEEEVEDRKLRIRLMKVAYHLEI
jgi:hypothetical protein